MWLESYTKKIQLRFHVTVRALCLGIESLETVASEKRRFPHKVGDAQFPLWPGESKKTEFFQGGLCFLLQVVCVQW